MNSSQGASLTETGQPKKIPPETKNRFWQFFVSNSSAVSVIASVVIATVTLQRCMSSEITERVGSVTEHIKTVDDHVQGEFVNVRNDIGDLRQEIQAVREDVQELHGEVNYIQGQLSDSPRISVTNLEVSESE